VLIKVFFLQQYDIVKVMVIECHNLTLKERVLPSTPLFEIGVDFDIFHLKIWVLKDRVIFFRLQFCSSE